MAGAYSGGGRQPAGAVIGRILAAAALAVAAIGSSPPPASRPAAPPGARSYSPRQVPDPGMIEALVRACETGDRETVQRLLAEGVHPDGRGLDTAPALIRTVIEDRREVVALLLDHGADIEARWGDEGTTALEWATFLGHRDLVRLLIERGADVDAQASDGRYPLYIAYWADRGSIGEILLDRGASPNLWTRNTNSALRLAAQAGNRKLVERLLSHGADLKVPGNNEALTIASQRGHADVVRMLIAARVDPSAPSGPIGTTPLIAAVKDARVDVIDELIRSGVDLEGMSKLGVTALMIAARDERFWIVRQLVAAGADPGTVSLSGHRALDPAGRFGLSGEIIDLLTPRDELTPGALPAR